MVTRVLRSLTFRTVALGVALTLAVVSVDGARWLLPVERWCYDRRARYFQYFSPPPTDRLVHLDIDDGSLDTIGRWPWEREVLADIVDEVRLAGAEALSLDVIFSEPQQVRWVPVEYAKPAVPAPASAAAAAEPGEGRQVPTATGGGAGPDQAPPTRAAGGDPEPGFVPVDGDAKFAASLRGFGRVLVPVSFQLGPTGPRSPACAAAAERLTADLELPFDVVAGQVSGGPAALSLDEFLVARGDALARRITAELSRETASSAALRPRLLPRLGTAADNSSLARHYEEVYRLTASLLSVGRFALPRPPDCPPLLDATPRQMPLRAFADAAWTSGFVDYMPFEDGNVRSIPLWVNFRGRLYPQMDLALACAVLGTEVRDVRVGPDELSIPTRTGGTIRVPIRTVPSPSVGDVGGVVDLPWFGGTDWATMYDHPNRREPRQHVPAAQLWGLAVSRRAVARNAAEAVHSAEVLAALGSGAAEALVKRPPAAADAGAWTSQLELALKEVAPVLEAARNEPPDRRTDDDREAIKAYDTAARILAEWRAVTAEAAVMRTKFAGKVVLFGGTATALGDMKPTSLHGQCPGVVVHGVLFNALITGHFWTTAPGWVTGLITLGMGLAVTAAKAWLGAAKAFLATLLLAAGYALVNGLVLFDYGDRVVGLAGPLVAAATVWGLLTLTRYISETRERARITRRFQRYVDPALVNYLIDHPELARFDGEVREMTVMFTDLAGYTSLTEKLRERAVKILGRYKALMVPAIRKHRGLIHAFMGDGIMASYGAPIPNEHNAADAVATALEIQAVTAAFNEELAAGGHDRVVTRVGICTGPAVVGDSGSDEGSDYACLGNTTNLAARLESANKAVGTTIMLSGRTVELAGDRFLVRPIARMVVKGKTEWEMTYELLAPAGAATDDQRRLAALTTEVFDAYVAARFADCEAAADRLEAAFGPSKLAALYRDACGRHRANPPADFQGQIVLREK